MQTAISHSIDLHCHSVYSDGSLTLDGLLHHVAEHGVRTLAITDHDSVGIHHELAKSALLETSEVKVIGGVEISCGFGNREIHVVGLNIDINEPGLMRFLAEQQLRRRERLLAYAEKLEQLKLGGVIEAVEQLTAEAVTRTHLSQILVELGHVQDSQRAFKRYIGRKARAYIAMQWPSLDEVVRVIRGAGGVAVIAHPGRYQMSRKQLAELLDSFVDAGGQAIELSYPNYDATLNRWLAEQAEAKNLYASQGSDFHNPEWRWVKPGHFPKLPKNVEPVWQLWDTNLSEDLR